MHFCSRQSLKNSARFFILVRNSSKMQKAERRVNMQKQKKNFEKKSKTEGASVQAGSVQGNGPKTNLDHFLERIGPAVPAQHLAETTVRELRNHDKKFHPFFTLTELWDSFKRPSAYGVEVPLNLNGKGKVDQYYVPFLSGIQLYGYTSCDQRKISDEGNAGSSEQIEMSSDDQSGEHGRLLFQYFEEKKLYYREPLADKVLSLACNFPLLKTYRSCDLTPSSWLCIAWYPIYSIPLSASLEKFEACFLTFHPLATPDHNRPDVRHVHKPTVDKHLLRITLTPFGLAWYKFKVSDWSSDGVHGCEKLSPMARAAGDWLRSLDVKFHDYICFCSSLGR